MKTISSLIDDSYMATASTQKKEKIRPAKEWIIPANPKYYDIVHAFDDTDEIEREKFTFEVLSSEYGIYAVRGPRGIPNSLSEALK